MQKIAVVLNLSARTASKIDTNEILATIKNHLPNARIHIVKKSFEQTLQRALKDKPDVICAGGGDGTISGVAAVCAKNNLILGVLPLGTMNNFSKDLDVPQDITKACKIIAKGKKQQIDYATVNGDLFLNNSSIGVYAKYVAEREKQQTAHGKIVAYLTGLISAINKFSSLHATIESDNKIQLIKTPLIFVSNNDYSINERPFIRRKTLSGNRLAVHLIAHGKKNIMFSTFKNIFVPNKSTVRYKTFHTTKLTINTTNKRIVIAKDGEIITAKLPLEYEIHAKALGVIVP